MKVRLLELSNYRRHRDTRIEVPDGVTALLGRNGSGKSTLLEALGFALFGVPATRTGKDLLRWDGAAPGDPVRVHVELELGGEALGVTRELRGKNLTPQASLEVDGRAIVPTGAGSSDAVTQEIQKRLGMDREAFFATIVARQKELARLGDMGPTERKRLILGMLGVDALDRAIATARGRRRTAEERVATLRGELPDPKDLEAEVATAAKAVEDAGSVVTQQDAAWKKARAILQRAQEALAKAEAAHEKRRATEQQRSEAAKEVSAQKQARGALAERLEAAARAAQNAAELRPKAKDVDALRQRLEAAGRADEARKRMEALQRGRDALEVPPPLNGELERLREAHAELSKDVRRAGEEVAVLKSSHAEITQRLERIADLGEDAACPTCQRPLEDHLPALRQALGEDLDARHGRLAEAQDAAARLKKRFEQVERDLDATAKKEAERREREKEKARLDAEIAALAKGLPPQATEDVAALRQQVDAAAAAERELLRQETLAGEKETFVRQHDAATKQLAGSEERLRKADSALASLPATAPALQEARRAAETAARAERDGEKAVLAARHQEELARERHKNARKRQDEIRARRKRLRSHEEEARYWAALAGGRGRGMLEAFKDHLVARIGPAVSREASRLLAAFTAGRYTEVLLDPGYELYVADGGVHYTLDRFSGGESDLVHLALRLAVSRLLLERSGGTELRFLALDEVFGSLDDERRAAVLGALQELGGLYSQVLLVTHQEALRDALDAVLRVEERDGEAVVSMHKG